MIIEDGTNSRTPARVNLNSRLLSDSVQISKQDDAVFRGDAYNINTGLVTLGATSSEAGILYIKNNETRGFTVTGIVSILGPSTGGDSTDTVRVRIYKNPTTGTLISSPTNADDKSNRNFGSTKTLNFDAFKGDSGATPSTVTNGTVHIESLVNPGSRVFFAISEEMTPGDTMAVTYEPTDNNTNMKTMCAIIGHLRDDNE